MEIGGTARIAEQTWTRNADRTHEINERIEAIEHKLWGLEDKVNAKGEP